MIYYFTSMKDVVLGFVMQVQILLETISFFRMREKRWSPQVWDAYSIFDGGCYTITYFIMFLLMLEVYIDAIQTK